LNYKPDNMPKFEYEKYQATKSKVFNQLIETGTVEMFTDTFEQLLRYADINNLKKPEKGALLNYLMREGLQNIDPETYFKKL
jgi:hypothetical protein